MQPLNDKVKVPRLDQARIIHPKNAHIPKKLRVKLMLQGGKKGQSISLRMANPGFPIDWKSGIG